MRMSCNGCRVLRKGCSEDCSLRPCLQWIKTPESQANATVFLAKFYGRAGLVNLINAGPEHLRPEVFKSLLYEACGRIINPIYGAVGLLWSGNWKRVQEAVESVLEGSPIMQLVHSSGDPQDEGRHPIMPIKGSDIRHLSKDSSPVMTHHRIRTRNRFKRPACSTTTTTTTTTHNNNNINNNNNVVVDSVVTTHEHDELMMVNDPPVKFSITGWVEGDDSGEQQQQQQKQQQQQLMMMMMMKRAESHDSFSVETVEPSLVMMNQAQFVKSETPMASDQDQINNTDHDIGLELTLGLNPMRCAAQLSTIAAAAPGFNLDVV